MRMQKTIPITALVLTTVLTLCPIATASGSDTAIEQATPQAVPSADPELVESTNFQLVTLIDQSGPLLEVLGQSSRWTAVVSERSARVRTAVTSCADDSPCRVRAIRWTDGEIEASGVALLDVLSGTNQLSTLATAMRTSGAFARYAHMPDTELVSHAWHDVADGHNRILDVQGLGEAPLYPAIDSITFEPNSDLWQGVVVEATNHLLLPREQENPVSPREELAHRFSLLLLYLNERENAGFFPDLHSRHNAAARQAISTTDWEAYPYSVILVLGDGPDRDAQTVGTYGKMRLARAAMLYNSGMAPFLVVSGGNVHPALTPINEALEMKRELMERHGIPESAIVMEPHARHTTTNFRNTARLMIRYGIPLDRPALATTSEGHSRYAGGAEFDQKAMDEISFIPREVIRRLNPYDIVFLPNPLSTHRDNRDPLDP